MPCSWPGSAAPRAPSRPPPRRPPRRARTLRTSDAPPALLGALRRELGLDRRQAERRLANEAEAGATAGRLRAALGADFAGAWVRGAKSATLTVATTDPAEDDLAYVLYTSGSVTYGGAGYRCLQGPPGADRMGAPERPGAVAAAVSG
ncbi:hypothetical protein ACE1SV_61520 [Streptomyces sp. E-15]